MQKLTLFLMLFQMFFHVYPQTLNLPPRPAAALTGSEFSTLVWDFTLTDRENAIYAQVLSGNIPDFQRNLIPVSFNQTINSTVYNVTYYVLPDYMAVGCDTNYFLIPMTPVLAQKLANYLKCTMPTRKMVDQIWSNSTVKLAPSTIPPTPAMTTIPVMWQHNQTVWGQRQAVISAHPLGELVGGTKKDVVISNKIYGNPAPNRVVIYGWHYLSGTPIQPIYSGHEESYADYSHGIRLVQDSITINGQPGKITTILKDDLLYPLFSDEGKIPVPYYPLGASATQPPSSWGVISNGANSLRFLISNNPEVTHYIVHMSADGKIFTSSVILNKSNLVLNGLQTDSLYFFKLRAVGADTSIFSEVLAAIPSADPLKVIIVNGFDRSYTGNSYDFVRMHAAAIKNYGHNFASATNEAIVYGLINLNNYDIAVWILGTESTANETFSTTEQNYVSAFLTGGGALFVSGTEIGWDLDFKGTTTDKNFFWNFLKSEYIADAPNNQANTFYTAEGITGSLFDGVTGINFDNGTHGTYNASYPDVINGKNGGINSLKYSGLTTTNVAGIVYKGLFPGGATNGAVAHFGFPFETIYPESKRFEVMNKILGYFEDLTDIPENENQSPSEFVLFQNYPNPFNPNTVINYRVPGMSRVTLTVYDLLGNQVTELVNRDQPAGNYSVNFNAEKLSSGIYICRLTAGNFVQSIKMSFVK
ncbi:MAG: T9SS type A sorting domain-containing protein [Ignavibacteriaceae bacterium]